MRQTIDPYSYKDKLASIPTKVVDLIAFLQEVVESVPKSSRDSIELEYDYEEDYGSYYVTADLWFTRPDTAEEAEKKERAKLVREEGNKMNELRQLAQLKAKYGDGV